MNYNQVANEATMYFECQTHFGRWVKFSCITMSLFIVILRGAIQNYVYFSIILRLIIDHTLNLVYIIFNVSGKALQSFNPF